MNKIRFRKYLIFPKTQLKYAAIFSGIVLTSLICVSTVIGPLFNTLFRSQCDEESFSILRGDFITFYLCILGTTTALTFVTTVLVTHRFMGPFYAVKRSLDFYREEKKFKHIQVRKNDETRPLIDELNRFFKELDSHENKNH